MLVAFLLLDRKFSVPIKREHQCKKIVRTGLQCEDKYNSLLLLQVANLLLGRKLSVQNESISVRELQCEDKYNSLLLLQVASWPLDQKLSV